MGKVLSTARTLWAYFSQRRLRLSSEAQLHLHQAQALQTQLDWLVRHSPGLAQQWQGLRPSEPEKPFFGGSPDGFGWLARLPVVSKPQWLAQFDQTNTAGLTLAQARDAALAAEHERDFSSTVRARGRDYTVGLSSGTSGSRGVFVVSAEEQARWAGVTLAKLLPRGLFAGERVAFFLRANSNLYTATRSRWLSFEYFDLMQGFESHLARLTSYRPSIVVAPAQVLQALAPKAQALGLSGCYVISVAEVLEPSVRELLERSFARVGEVYQATEGLLATTCEHGRLHLNEENLVVEPEWLGEGRFVPVVTDLRRRTQPLVRFRLNDVLRDGGRGCPCGRVTRVVVAVEGRCDDQLQLPGPHGERVTVFSDAVSRALALGLPTGAEYELVQQGLVRLSVRAQATALELEHAKSRLERLFQGYRVDTTQLQWALEPLPLLSAGAVSAIKRRRIRRE